MTMHQFARDVVAVCESLKLSRVWLFSQSLGGRVGAELLRMKPEGLKIDGLFAFAPPWRLRKAPLTRLPRVLRSTGSLLRRLGKQTGYLRSRTPSRQQYTIMRDMPDFHLPVMIEEVKGLSWRRYARLLLGMRLGDFGPNGGWNLESSCPIYVFAARDDRFIDNRKLEELAEHEGMEFHWVDCRHVSLMTNVEHAQSVAESVCRVIAGHETG